jgi:hypothetical protein
MDTGAVLGGTGVFLSIAGIVYSAINHKHIRSKCCGREIDFSIDIESTTQDKETKKEEKHEEKKEDVKEKKKEDSSDNDKIPKNTPRVHDGEIPMFKFRPLKVMPHFDV